ncbi:hypothetical protein QZM39_15595 [Burkholderia cenocepacia]|uniref:hypothetical protein n=1 Tax=Burkholderia cenocepacia TaxID=95486 RepID=UPI00264B8B1A|nr:hypothetical protein [Burkholderia cenocepacia]MDN7621270.1 hypothetical protein [Burkholderia cenocepacia]
MPVGDACATGDRVMAFAWLRVILFGTLPTVLHPERRHPKPIEADRGRAAMRAARVLSLTTRRIAPTPVDPIRNSGSAS